MSAGSSTVAAVGQLGSSGTTSVAAGPQRFPYLFRHILDLPRRLIHPPNPSVPRVGSVRSFKLTPCYRVTLQDVLKGRHLPPLGRKEFEDFLYFKEYSVENLYFYTWLEQYQAQWNHWLAKQQSNVTATATEDDVVAKTPSTNPSPKLAMSYARAKETFFTHGSPWELNLPQKTLQLLLHPQKSHPGPKAHPHPCAFAEVRFEVENYLTDSLTRFIAQNGGNAGRHRGLFAVTIGLVIVALGLLPIILLSLGPHDTHSWHTKLRRLSSIPVLWLGLATVIAGLHGICVIIFLFGDARQLYSYELRLPAISSPIHCAPDSTLNPNFAANEYERKRLSLRRPTLPFTVTYDLGTTGNVSGQQSSLTVAVSAQQEEEAKTDYVHLPNRKRSGTVTSTTSATREPSESKCETKVPNLDDPALIVAENQLNFDLYDEEEDMKADVDMNRYDGGSISELHGMGVKSQTPTNYSPTLYPDTPIGFNFDSLPLPPGMRAPNWKLSRSGSNSTSPECCQSDQAVPSTWHNMEALSSSVNVTARSSVSHLRRKVNQIKGWEWNKERTVFAPLTMVLDPVITRIQWEIVMRSALLALLITIVVACGSLGIP